MPESNVVIVVDESELGSQLPSLLKAVEGGRWVEVRRGGQPIANIQPSKRRGLTPMHPDLMGVRFNNDPAEPLDASDWPEQQR